MLLDIPKTERVDFNGGYGVIKVDTFNQRIKIVAFEGDIAFLLEKIEIIAKKVNAGKIFYIGGEADIKVFKKNNFIMEAKVYSFLKGEPGYFLSKFLKQERKMSLYVPEEEEVLIRSRDYIKDNYEYIIYDKYEIRDACEEDAEQLARLYKSVFETYPSPMNNGEYIKYAMKNHVYFKVITYNNRIISSASADMDPENYNAEMTDCATEVEHRGQGLMGRLILELEKEMRRKNYNVFYSTARSISAGMNIIFAKHNYEYGGKLVNHCHICGGFENMNIWVKVL
ncbi:beta-lysine acetyltransferase [Natranaerovirga pectinivora]|uniref:Beta-lysine acetyltransferase n=1 Tax=Natranaerovirga pectinivora TaxID=682400 RepID=A0A4R3MMH5_9FIRM|nr:putative beta-lysine N-acetyltransferase [Natranaerovirga pectinivora]TCT16159.1 beta-lysine acetyltransferase [Natranaerovirga pectinivora]